MSDNLDPPSLPEANDHQLMHLVAQGRRDAFTVLLRRHQPAALTLAYRFIGRWDAAEDICQEAFVRTFQAAPSYRPTAEFTTWLYRVVANLCWDHRRRAARRPEQLSEAAPRPSPEEPSVALEKKERQARVQRAVTALPDRQRLVLILHRYHGLPHREITQITGWSTGAVESCLVRAYSKLRELLQDMKVP